MSDDRLMDKYELADRLGVSWTWVRDAITKRSIPITWVGRHARFDEDDYRAIVAAGKEAAANQPDRLRSVEPAVVQFQPRSPRKRRAA